MWEPERLTTLRPPLPPLLITGVASPLYGTCALGMKLRYRQLVMQAVRVLSESCLNCTFNILEYSLACGKFVNTCTGLSISKVTYLLVVSVTAVRSHGLLSPFR
jgi:hypothetical protein